MANEFHTGGITSPHEWDLSVLESTGEYAFWDEFLNGMADRYLNNGYHHTEFYKNEYDERDVVAKVTGIDKRIRGSFGIYN